jgi:molybdopterin converting factor small subunit
MSAPSEPRLRVTVLLFARYAEEFGTSSMVLELDEPATIASVVDILRRGPNGAALPPRPLVARNREHAHYDTPLAEGDEVAVLPALAGG